MRTREASWSAPAPWRFGNGANERRRALAKPMPACFATLLRPGTGALRRSGETSAPGDENCRCQNQFGMDDRGKWRLNLAEMEKEILIEQLSAELLRYIWANLCCSGG